MNNLFQSNSNIRCIQSLSEIPPHWALTPVVEKKPRRPNWQTEETISRSELIYLLENGQRLWSRTKNREYLCKWTGIGLITGEKSKGLVAIDVDGSSAIPLLADLSKGDITPLTRTVAWTSGKPGRGQLLFQVPIEIQRRIEGFTKRDVTQWGNFEAAKKESGEYTERLEFRYNRCHSVLPPSLHPDTGRYRWINSPAHTQVVEAPEWLCDLLLQFAQEERDKERQLANLVTSSKNTSYQPFDNRLLVEYAAGFNFIGRDGWITAKCPAHDGTSFESLHINKSTGIAKCHADCDGKAIHAALRRMAIASGYQPNKQKPIKKKTAFLQTLV